MRGANEPTGGGARENMCVCGGGGLSNTDPEAGAGCKCRSWCEDAGAGAETSGKNIRLNRQPREDRATI